jgi:mannitol-specific phosphotransferase system IIBC component
MEDVDNKDDFKGLFSNKKTRNFTSWVVGITTGLLGVFLIINKLLCIKDFGQLGDFFNGIAAPVLSLVTIILLYNSFLVQKEELKATRIALEQSTKEMQNSAAIMERTEQNAKLERLENIVFKLLEKYEANRSGFYVLSNGVKLIKLNGIDGLNAIYRTISNSTTINILRKRLNDDSIQAEKTPAFINSLIKAYFSELQKREDYNLIKNLVYKFIPVYKYFHTSSFP